MHRQSARIASDLVSQPPNGERTIEETPAAGPAIPRRFLVHTSDARSVRAGEAPAPRGVERGVADRRRPRDHCGGRGDHWLVLVDLVHAVRFSLQAARGVRSKAAATRRRRRTSRRGCRSTERCGRTARSWRTSKPPGHTAGPYRSTAKARGRAARSRSPGFGCAAPGCRSSPTRGRGCTSRRDTGTPNPARAPAAAHRAAGRASAGCRSASRRRAVGTHGRSRSGLATPPITPVHAGDAGDRSAAGPALRRVRVP